MGNALSTEQHTTYEQCISPITGKLDAHVWLEVEGKVIGIPIGGKAKKRHGKKKNKKTKEARDKWPNIKSINQSGIYSVCPKYPLGPLDDIHVHLPLMLDWLEELGWRVLTMTNEYRTCDYLLVQ